MSSKVPSPVADIYKSLSISNAAWNAEIARPTGSGWIAGVHFRDATTGPFNALLVEIGKQLGNADEKTVAASFALRFGWASAMAIVPYLRFQCVPDISLENVSFKFHETTFFERTAVYEPRGAVVAGDPRGNHELMSTVETSDALMRALRDALVAQSAPVVQALFDWCSFAHRGTWGILTSSWASQFTTYAENYSDQRDVAPQLDALFAGDDIVAEMRPEMRVVSYLNEIHLYQRRASCCRYYLLPQGNLCASCPLVSDEERMERNIDWMKTQHERSLRPRGHS
ncbi:MAG: (2Fe-2S)-binding protein [Gemmatimonadaceae bacterium]